MKILIVSSAHQSGDIRLMRHAQYLAEAGHDVSPFARGEGIPARRLGALFGGLGLIWRIRPDVTIIPDPEMFVLGSLVARARGGRALIDIHEDYALVAAGRTWVPRELVGVVSYMARLNEWLGRRVANGVVVAAPQLAKVGDIVVENIPRPGSIPTGEDHDDDLLVYVGDVTKSRGALDMVRTLAYLAPLRLEVIGRISGSLREEMTDLAHDLGVEDRLEIRGPLPHHEAWERARQALGGFCLLRPLPAYEEAVATKIWEYMAAGIPPIVSDLPGQRAVVAALETTLVCSDESEVAAAAKRLREEPAWRAELVEAGKAAVETKWERSRPDLAIQSAVGSP